jgi:hypothetical protein
MAELTKSFDLIEVIAERLANEILARLKASKVFHDATSRWFLESKSGRRARRSPEALAELSDELVTYVKRNPGTRVGEIARAFGQPKGSLIPTFRKLVAGKKLKVKGVRAGVKYFAK